MDVFKEQLVKREANNKSRAIQIGLLAAAAFLSAIAFLFLGMLSLVLMAIFFYVAYYFAIKQNVEYEYVFTNGELDIDAIYNRAKRKRILSIDLRNAELLAHVNDKAHENTFLGVQVLKDFSSGVIKDNTYQIIIPINGTRTKVRLEPNESLLTAFRQSISPRKMFLKK